MIDKVIPQKVVVSPCSSCILLPLEGHHDSESG